MSDLSRSSSFEVVDSFCDEKNLSAQEPDINNKKNLDQILPIKDNNDIPKTTSSETENFCHPQQSKQQTSRIKRSLARLRQEPLVAIRHEARSKLLLLNIPCPKCKKENCSDCFWYCEKCLVRMRCDARIIFCGCSHGSLEDYEFRCMWKNHGDEYFSFEQYEVNDLLKRLCLTKTVNLVLLGLTGVGKTMFINSIANYLKYESIEEALDNDLIYKVPTYFQITDEEYNFTDVKVGEETEYEIFTNGESATRCPQVTSISYNNLQINLIDTSGLCDTLGHTNDKENLNQMLNYICGFNELHGICIMLKSNESRKLDMISYCIRQLLLNFHKNSIKNLVFCFTNTRGSTPQDTTTVVRELLKSINEENGTNINVNKETCYSMDNEAFRLLCAKEKNIPYGNKDDQIYCIEAWNKSRKATFSLINHVLANPPYLTNETVAINNARSIIIGLNKPLAVITELIQRNKTNFAFEMERIAHLTGEEQDFKSKIKTYIITAKKEELGYWRVVCDKCTKVKRDDNQRDYKVFPKVCCEYCRAPFLYFCFTFDLRAKCKKCSCPKSHHEYINYVYREVQEQFINEKAQNDLETVKSKIQEKMQTIENLYKVIKGLDEEQKFITKCAAKFAFYLKTNSFRFNTRSHEEYLKMKIENANLAENYLAVQNLKEALEEYLNQKEILDKQLSESSKNSSLPKEITAEDIVKAQDELFKLELNGQTLKNIFDKELANPLLKHYNSIKHNLSEKLFSKDDKKLTHFFQQNAHKKLSHKDEEKPRIDDNGRALRSNSLKHPEEF